MIIDITMPFVYADGGRAAAGYQGKARAIANVTGRPYQEIYDRLASGNYTQRRSKHDNKSRGRTAANGISTRRKWFDDYMQSLGFRWVPTMRVGQGCTVHLRAGELPMGKLVVSVSRHFTAVIDGVIFDTFEPSRAGTRCVYGYYVLGAQP